jgi:hypothetical protein
VTTPSDIIAKLRAVGAVQRYRVNFDGSLYKHATGDIVEYGEVADLIEAAPALADVVQALIAKREWERIMDSFNDDDPEDARDHAADIYEARYDALNDALARLTDQSDGKGVES